MDKILKLVIGCLAMIGLVVMIIPNSDPLAPGNPNMPVEGANIPPPPAAAQIPPPPEPQAASAQSNSSSGGFAVEDYNIGNYGQPMIDPTPPGQRNEAAQTPYGQQLGVPVNPDQVQGPPVVGGQPQYPKAQQIGVPIPPLPVVGAE